MLYIMRHGKTEWNKKKIAGQDGHSAVPRGNRNGGKGTGGI